MPRNRPIHASRTAMQLAPMSRHFKNCILKNSLSRPLSVVMAVTLHAPATPGTVMKNGRALE